MTKLRAENQILEENLKFQQENFNRNEDLICKLKNQFQDQEDRLHEYSNLFGFNQELEMKLSFVEKERDYLNEEVIRLRNEEKTCIVNESKSFKWS